MPIAMVTFSRDYTRRHKVLDFTTTVSGNYVAGGDTLNLTTTTNPKMMSNGRIAATPKRYEVVNRPAGYTAEILPGTTLSNWLLKIWASPGVELAAGPYPAALLADPFLLRFGGPLGNF